MISTQFLRYSYSYISRSKTIEVKDFQSFRRRRIQIFLAVIKFFSDWLTSEFYYSKNVVNRCSFFHFPDRTNEDLHHFTFVPNLAEFEALRAKEQTLSELFGELDLDKDGLIGAEELRDFCEDIGQEITKEGAVRDIALVDANKDGKIDKDEWIELMFPKFNIQ